MHVSLVSFSFCVFLAYQIALSIALSGVSGAAQSEVRTCKTTADCRRRECCVEPDLRRGRRSLGPVIRTCQKMGRPARGGRRRGPRPADKCYMTTILTYEAQSYYFKPGCPCRKRSYCKFTGTEVPQGDIGECVKMKKGRRRKH